MEPTSILRPGENCWRIEPAHKLAFLIDGECYFAAVRNALERARHAVYILGWDIDSRIQLTRNGEEDGYPKRLGEFLNEIALRRRHLHIHVLVWDFAMIYTLEREWLPIYKLGWKSHHRVHFRMDGRHPPGASQHQKIVVIDDRVAFLGGMDLSKWRWDTPAHRPVEPRRSGPEGHLYPPYHDVQAVVSGEAARALGELARDRWWRATEERLKPPAPVAVDPWPDDVMPDVRHAKVALARTFPLYNGWEEVREVERLFLDSIRAAHRTIYIENQYFTSRTVCELLAQRLAEADGPEIVIILPKQSTGWLEQHTMDVLRADMLEELRRADHHGHLAVFYPDHPDIQIGFINVHDKVMIVDDDFLRIGSANLSNRSMGLDSECDLAIESRGDPILAAAVARFRDRLLAEHLETRPEIVERVFRREGSLIGAISAMRRPGRSLIELVPQEKFSNDWVAEPDLIDPERPIAAEALVARLLDEEAKKPARRRVTLNVILILIIVALAALWRFTPMRAWLDIEKMFALLQSVGHLAVSPFLITGGFVVAGLLVVPLTFLIIVTVLAFGPALGFVYSIIGSLLSAMASYGLGHWLGRDTVRRLAGARLNALSQRLARRGILAVIVVRIIPIAPFTLVNVVAGASHIRFRDFVLGTFFGMLPGLLSITLFIDSIAASIENPKPRNFAILAVVTVAIAFSAWGLRRLLRRRRGQAAEGLPPGTTRD